MHKAIEVLMTEHRRIEQALGSLESFTLEVEGGLTADRAILGDFATFFREYADASHHGKEEDVLFARMTERGLSRESGPVAVMLYEHVVGRGHVGALRQVAQGSGAVSAVEARAVVEHGAAFVPHLRSHIRKEDRVIYPLALRVLPESDMDAIEAQFEAHDPARRADGTYDRLDALVERLLTSFRPDPARMAAAAHMIGCAAEGVA